MTARVSAPQWGCNLYATEDDALREGRDFARGRPLKIWRTKDDLFDWTLGPNPRSLPHLADATLVLDGGDPSPDQYVCSECDFSTSSASAMLNHKRWKHPKVTTDAKRTPSEDG